MDQPPKASDDSVVEDLKRALEGAACCIELARREAERVEATFRALSPGGALPVEQKMLADARRRRKELATPPPPIPERPLPTLDEKEALAEPHRQSQT
jgi:hypothetical protein